MCAFDKWCNNLENVNSSKIFVVQIVNSRDSMSLRCASILSMKLYETMLKEANFCHLSRTGLLINSHILC